MCGFCIHVALSEQAASLDALSAVQVMVYSIFPAIVAGAALMWLRLRFLAKLAKSLHNSFNVCKATVLANTMDSDVRNSNCVVAMMGDLRKIHRFRDVRQVSCTTGMYCDFQ